MSTKPRPILFEDVASQFENLDAVMSPAWMARRKVTMPEAQALCGKIALILRGFTALHPEQQIAFITRGVLTKHQADELTG